MFFTLALYIILVNFYSNNFVTSTSEYPILLIISYDGFRCDYYDKGVNPFLKSLRKKGTYARYMNNVFPTRTLTNHHSIATGTYSETHGVVGDEFYDSFYNRKIDYSYEMFHYSDDVIPIWIVNEIKGEGRHSGVSMWPGGDYNYSGINPTYLHTLDETIPFEKRMDEAVEWILDPEKPANLVLLHLEEPDATGHVFGPDSDEMTEQLSEMDSITKYLINKLAEKNLENLVNLFFISDHGMQFRPRENKIDLSDFVNDDLYDKYDAAANSLIYPKTDQDLEVYNALKTASDNGAPFKVYLKSEIPERWHYKNNRRTPKILAAASSSFVFLSGSDKDDRLGVHGYDNGEKNMKPHFLAIGPLIKENYEIEPFENVDLFSLWALILRFPEYEASTNGSFYRVSKMLKQATIFP